MQDRTTQEGSRRAPAAPVARRPRTAPSSSRMFASYLSDIERLLDEQRWERALRAAGDLPQIAVALADPGLRSSGEQVHQWCQEWIRPLGAERDAHGVDFERLSRSLAERVQLPPAPAAVPMHALRRLQLSRHARTLPRGFAWRAENLSSSEAETVEMCTALLEAARRWYARSACHDPTVQANLARLAVLR
jgi:hypothetical protein